MLKVRINIAKLNTTYRRNKALRIQCEMEHVLNHSVYKKKWISLVQAAMDNGSFKKGEKSDMRSFTDAKALFIVMHSGYETLDPINDFVLNIDVDDYFSFKRVIGYTYPSIRGIFINTRYFDKRSNKLCGSNFKHESDHKVGAKHSFYKNKWRKFCICYLSNVAYEDSFDKIYWVQPKPKRKYRSPWRRFLYAIGF